MRPKITGQLEQDVNKVYEHAGYATPSELVRDAVRRRVSELKDQHEIPDQDISSLFNYEIRSHPTTEILWLDLEPKQNTGIRMKYQTNVGNNYVELQTESDTYRESDICGRFEGIDGVVEAKFITEPQIRFGIDQNTERPFSVIIEEIFTRLSKAIGIETPEEIEEQKQGQLEAAVKQYADPR